MRTAKYIKECWQELWNPDSYQWQIVDRILFPTLPVIAFLAYLLPRTWGGAMSNLVWVIPLAIWVMFLVFFIPYRLVSKYHNRHEATLEELSELWLSGNAIRTEIYKRYKEMTADDAKSLSGAWMQQAASIFLSNPHELGKARLISLHIENQDADIPIPEGWSRQNLITGYYIKMAIQTGKINAIVQDLLK